MQTHDEKELVEVTLTPDLYDYYGPSEVFLTEEEREEAIAKLGGRRKILVERRFAHFYS